MKLPSRWPRKKKKEETPVITQKKRKILVISWWGFRWTYALWILKAIEENNINKEIDAIYWVSIWSIIWSLRAYWMKAEEIFWLLQEISIRDFYWNDILRKSGWFVSNKKIRKMIGEYLPKSFDDLHLPFYAGAVDTNKAEYHLFNSWDLQTIVLGSMSIPWVFPPVKYEEYNLVDWWVLNNFPVDIAKQHYPEHEIIWIALNKFQTNQKIKSAFDNLQITFEVMMRSKLLENTRLVDYLFYRSLEIGPLSLNKKQMHETFALWYEDWCNMFGKSNS
jgi:NTE family protein